MKNFVIKNICTFAMPALISSALFSCSQPENFQGKTPLAKVYDSYLYYEDLGDLVPKGSSAQDSAAKVKSYIDVWAKQQLMIKKAEINLSPEQKDVQKQLDEYRNNLLIYKYNDAYIAQNLDTSVTKAQTKEYYDTHQDDMILNSAVVKAIFVQIPDNQDIIKTTKKLLEYRNDEDSLALTDFCKTKAVKTENFNFKWVTLTQACKFMPEMISEKNDILKTHGIITAKGDDFVYLLKIKDFIPAGGITPYDLEEKTISRILINKRKTKLITDLETNIFTDAVSRGNLEFFNPQTTK